MKKLLITALALAVLVTPFIGVAQVSAQTNDALRAQVQSLLEMVAKLQAQLQARSVATGSVSSVATVMVDAAPGRAIRCILPYASVGSQADGVYLLQEVLKKEGVYPEGLVTGYFGNLTYAALVRFQSNYGLEKTGKLDEKTLEMLHRMVKKYYRQCETDPYVLSTPSPTPSNPPGLLPSPAFVRVLSPNGGEIWQVGSTHTIKWDSGNFPANGSIGIALTDVNTTHTYLFTNQSNEGYEYWTIPSTITPGSYRMRIWCGERGTERYCSPDGSLNTNPYAQDYSDGYFTISNQSGNQAPVITGVSGPTNLQIGQTGTWTITAYDPEQGNLSYSVNWGENAVGVAGSAPVSSQTRQTTTFTHVYYGQGTYTIWFTVMDNQGLTAQSSMKVDVGSGQASACSLNARVTDTYLDWQENISSWGWGFYVVVNATNPPSTSKGWTTNFEGYVPVVTPYGKTTLYGNFFVSSGPLKFTPRDQVDNNCNTTITVYPPSIPSSSQYITVLSPNGGETWVKGTTQTINWRDNSPAMSALPKTYDVIAKWKYECPSTSADAACVALEGADYPIARNVSGTSYRWKVGDTLSYGPYARVSTAPDGTYSIQVCVAGTTQCDVSNSYFKITSLSSTPTPVSELQIVSPKQGDSYKLNSVVNIQVTSRSKPVKVFLYLYKGNTYIQTIGEMQTGTARDARAYYSWTIPQNLRIGSDYRIGALTMDVPTNMAYSGYFSIVSPAVEVEGTQSANLLQMANTLETARKAIEELFRIWQSR